MQRFLAVALLCVLAVLFLPLPAPAAQPPMLAAQPPTPTVSVRAAPLYTQPQEIVIAAQNAAQLTLYAELPRILADEVLWSPGGLTLAVVAGDTVLLYDTSDLDIPPRELLHSGETVTDIAFNPDGRLLATATRQGPLRLWYVPDGTLRQTIDTGVRGVDLLAYSPNGALLAYAVITDAVPRGLYVYNLLDDSETPLEVAGIALPYTGLAFNRDGSLLLGSAGSGHVGVWDTQTLAAVTMWSYSGSIDVSADFGGQVGSDPRDALTISPDGRYVLTADIAIQRRLRLWDAEDGDLLDQFYFGAPPNLTPTYFGLAFAPDSRTLAIASSTYPGQGAEQPPWGEAVLYDVEQQQMLAALPHPGVRSVAFNPDQTLFASVGGGYVRLWALPDYMPSLLRASTYYDNTLVAYCDSLGGPALPPQTGQTLGVLWSWYAADDVLLRAHVLNARYTVTLDGTPLVGWRYLTQVEPDPANDNYPTVYYFTLLGDLPQGFYTLNYRLNWREPVSDGFAAFGPGSATPEETGTCAFTVGN